jgi:hypothetical protein
MQAETDDESELAQEAAAAAAAVPAAEEAPAAEGAEAGAAEPAADAEPAAAPEGEEAAPPEPVKVPACWWRAVGDSLLAAGCWRQTAGGGVLVTACCLGRIMDAPLLAIGAVQRARPAPSIQQLPVAAPSGHQATPLQGQPSMPPLSLYLNVPAGRLQRQAPELCGSQCRAGVCHQGGDGAAPSSRHQRQRQC